MSCARSPNTWFRPKSCAARRRSEEHTSELQSLAYLVCRLLLEKKDRAWCGVLKGLAQHGHFAARESAATRQEPGAVRIPFAHGVHNFVLLFFLNVSRTPEPALFPQPTPLLL